MCCYKRALVMKAARICLSLAFALVLTQCAAPFRSDEIVEVRRAIVVQPVDASSSPLYVWHGGGSGGLSSINIDLSQQKAYIFRNGENVGWTYVATGRGGYRTPTGTFRITEKIVDKRSNRYGTIVDRHGNTVRGGAIAGVHRVPPGGRFVGAKMPYWMRITGSGIGMHAGAIPNPGSPASHGCIRLPYSMAQTIYQNAGVGTRVNIMH